MVVPQPYLPSPYHRSSQLSLPPQGHEYAGVVHASSCRAFKVGDHVVAPFTTSCGDCWYCQRGYSARCPKGKLFGSVMLDGAQAGYVKVPLAGASISISLEGERSSKGGSEAEADVVGLYQSRRCSTLRQDSRWTCL